MALSNDIEYLVLIQLTILAYCSFRFADNFVDGRFVAMVTKDLQTLNLKFDQVMFNSFVFTWERNFGVRFGIFSVLVFQISVLESYVDIYLF